MYYRHNLDYKYPEKCDEHMIEVKHLRDVTVDANYPYVRKDWKFKFLRVIYWLAQVLIMPWLLKITHGLRVYGRKNLRKHKKELKDGAITIANHVFMWDYLCVLQAIRPHLSFFPAWKTNLEGTFGPLIRMSGGIPIPTDSVRAMIEFKKAMEWVFENGKWMHVYPEGSMWFFYPDVRPFKKAVFTYAVKYDKPLIPIAMSFRPRRGLQKLFSKKPLVDLHIGEPMYADKSLSPAEAAAKMQADAYKIMQQMCGIVPGDPTYNEDQDPTHYHKTM